MSILRSLVEWWAWQSTRRKMRRRRREAKVLLALVLVCVFCQLLGLAFGIVGTVLQRLGVIPDDAPAPEGADLEQAQAISRGDGRLLRSVPALYKSAVMV